MRRAAVCVLMISLFLCACGAGERERSAEEEALAIRGEYLSLEGCSGSVELTADYGQRVYTYALDFTAGADGIVMELTAPETVAGLRVSLADGGGGALEYDGTILETGALDGQGLTPAGAVPTLLEALRGAYLDSCTRESWGEQEVLVCLFRDPELEQGMGREIALWLDCRTHVPLRAEISNNGACVLQCTFTQFDLRLPQDDAAAKREGKQDGRDTADEGLGGDFPGESGT